ncbi:hypothetical protein JEZ13_11850 [bacterium]|nr:hypothetical protein [bacterium]
MRKLISLLLMLILLVTLIGCGEKAGEKGQMNEGESETKELDPNQTEVFQIRQDPLPFEVVIKSLRPVGKEIAKQTPAKAFRVSENPYDQSFAIGVISADAVMAISSQDETKLRSYTEVLIEYSKNIGLKDEILMMADEIQSVLGTNNADKWERLEELIIKYQIEVELALYEADMLDQFTLMQLGGWSEGLYRISSMYLENWDEKGAKIINQKGIVNSLINNLQYIKSNKIKEAKYYSLASEGYAKIKDIIYSVGDDQFYTKDDLNHVNKITKEIVESIQKK